MDLGAIPLCPNASGNDCHSQKFVFANDLQLTLFLEYTLWRKGPSMGNRLKYLSEFAQVFSVVLNGVDYSIFIAFHSSSCISSSGCLEGEFMSSNFGISALTRVFNESSSDVRRRVIGIYAFLLSFNVLAWLLALIVFASHPALLLLALTAYTFGMRHAFDADHISAIDNVTRKLMQEKQRPVAVGFFFSLGHSTVVVCLTIFVAAATVAVSNFDTLKNVGTLIGTSVSALFLFLIAIINIVILVDIFRTFHEVKNGGEYNDQTLDESLNKRGLMGRFFRPLLRITNRSWKMYPVGFLFGLGFDTATEVGLLGIAATSVGHIPIAAILIFPALFTAGMSLMD